MEAEGAGVAGKQRDLSALQRGAAKRGRDYDKTSAAAAAATVPGSAAYVDYSRRAFYREFVKVGIGMWWAVCRAS